MNQILEDKLNKYYISEGISSTNFTCKHQEKCKNNNDKFTTAKEAFIGEEFGLDAKIPKLLFISLDSGGSRKDENQRTMAGVREIENKRIEHPNTVSIGARHTNLQEYF